jgi:rhamnulokinase
MSRYLAFDLGAESGRAIVGTVAAGRVSVQEVHRFPNRQVSAAGHLHWDVPYLFGELKEGLARAIRGGYEDLTSLGVDTWGVDFALVGSDGVLRGLPFAYRDRRTDGVMPRVFAKMSREEIFARTGIQCMQINSLYQLYAAHAGDRDAFDGSVRLLFMADLFNFLLSGVTCSEYTLASTSQLLNAARREWDPELFARLALPAGIMAPIVRPGAIIGPVSPGVLREVGATGPLNVVAVGCHDTASAVAAVPARGDDWAFLSSGTWSVIGMELDAPLLTADALANGFGNEGCVGGRIRFLRNVMGMWLLQQLRGQWQAEGKAYDHDDVSRLAEDAGKAEAIIDPEDMSFLHPPDMAGAIRAHCETTGQRAPRTDGEIVRCVLESLALKYGEVLATLGRVTGRSIRRLHIVGGGSRNRLLNQMTSDVCGVPVVAGPAEATALGNIMVQAMADGAVASVAEGRAIIRRSFPASEFSPRGEGGTSVPASRRDRAEGGR